MHKYLFEKEQFYFIRPIGIVLFIFLTVLPFCSAYPHLSFASSCVLLSICLFASPQVFLYAVLFLIPFGSYRALVTIGPIKIYWLFCFLLLVIIFIQVVIRKNIPQKMFAPVVPWLFYAFVWGLICTFFSPFRATAIKEILLMTIGAIFMALTLYFVNEDGYKKTLPRIILISISISSLLACIGFFSSSELGMTNRSNGGTSNPNVLAITIIYGMPFAVHLFFHSKHIFYKFMAIALVGINFLGMVTAYSRSGAMTLVLMFGVLSFIYRRFFNIRQIGFIGLAGLAAIGFALAVIPASYWERQASVVDTDAKSMSRRGSYVDVGMAAFKERPILGFGTGCFREVFARSEQTKRYARTPEERVRYAHNTYLEFLVGMGALGLLLFIGLILQVFWCFYKTILAYRQQGKYDLESITITYMVAFGFLMLYLFVLSDMQQKHMLVSIGISQIGYYYSHLPQRESDG